MENNTPTTRIAGIVLAGIVQRQRNSSPHIRTRQTWIDTQWLLDEIARLSRDLATLTGRLAEAETTIRNHEERLSEVVAPDLENSEWVETFDDGSEIPVMRGSPKLSGFIYKLHQMLVDANAERDAALSRAEKAEAGLREIAQMKNMRSRVPYNAANDLDTACNIACRTLEEAK